MGLSSCWYTHYAYIHDQHEGRAETRIDPNIPVIVSARYHIIYVAVNGYGPIINTFVNRWLREKLKPAKCRKDHLILFTHDRKARC